MTTANRGRFKPLLLVVLLGVAAVVALRPPDADPDKGYSRQHAPAPRPPRLVVESEPSGATLLVNGRLVGATPVTLDSIPGGRYGLRLERDGCKPATLLVDVSGDALVREKLEALPTGSLSVEIEPKGAEVLLDGELIGHTPLKLPQVPAGSYELLIRKTNFDSYSKQVLVEPGEALTFTGFELRDKVLAMLDGMVKAEPQRVAHYIDLGHYLFISDKMDEAVEAFTQGMETLQTPLNFDGAGYAGKENMTLVEMQVEQRLRKEDEGRFHKEVDKHRNWPRVDTKTFRRKMDEAQETLSRKNINSWTWAERAGRMHVKNRNLDRAAKTYADHIAAAKGSPDLGRAYVALIDVYLMQQDVARASTAFDDFFRLFKNDAAMLRTCGSAIFVYHDRVIGTADRDSLLELALRALRRGAELPGDAGEKLQNYVELGTVLVALNKANEAVPFLEKAVNETVNVTVQEERSLKLADALRKSGRTAEAIEIYKRLVKSERIPIREGAGATLEVIKNEQVPRKEPR